MCSRRSELINHGQAGRSKSRRSKAVTPFTKPSHQFVRNPLGTMLASPDRRMPSQAATVKVADRLSGTEDSKNDVFHKDARNRIFRPRSADLSHYDLFQPWRLARRHVVGTRAIAHSRPKPNPRMRHVAQIAGGVATTRAASSKLIPETVRHEAIRPAALCGIDLNCNCNLVRAGAAAARADKIWGLL